MARVQRIPGTLPDHLGLSVLLLSLILLVIVIKLVLTKFLFLGRLYAAVRSNGSKITPCISKGIYRELYPPWRRGSGIEFRVSKYVLHIGICKKVSPETSEEGFLQAMDGKWLDLDVDAIKRWN
jgi:hypothetical protein